MKTQRERLITLGIIVPTKETFVFPDRPYMLEQHVLWYRARLVRAGLLKPRMQ